MKKELANLKGKGPVVDPLSMERHIVDPLSIQRPHNGKKGLGYVAKKKKKNEKANPALAKKNTIASGVVIRDETTRSDFAGTKNPHHILYVDF